jgi:hypothetical protein
MAVPAAAMTTAWSPRSLGEVAAAKSVLVQSLSTSSLQLAESSKHAHFSDRNNTLYP